LSECEVVDVDGHNDLKSILGNVGIGLGMQIRGSECREGAKQREGQSENDAIDFHVILLGLRRRDVSVQAPAKGS
jgi:hypothetical protein